MLGLLRQVAHLVGNHGEAPALLTCPSRFDGGVEGQQIGLFGDAANGGKDGVNVLAVLGQGLYHGCRTTDLGGQGADGCGSLLHDVLAIIGRAIGMVGSFGSLGGVARHILGGGGHLMHGGGDLIDLGHLPLYTLVGADGDIGGVLGGVADLLHRSDHVADHVLQLVEEGVETVGNLPEFIGTVDLQTLGQVTVTLGDIIEHQHHLPQRVGDAIADEPDHQQADTGYQQTDQGHAESVFLCLLGEAALQFVQVGKDGAGR